jgi:hypothetical protein
MTTSPHNPHTRRSRRGPSVLLLIGALASALVVSLSGGNASSARPAHEALRAGAIDTDDLDGRDPRVMDSKRPKVEASFPLESYGPGSNASLVFVSSAKAVTLQFFRAGTEARRPQANDVMYGSSVSGRRWLGKVWPRRTVRVRIGNWPSGVYFAQLTARGGRVGYTPFVLRPRRLGEHRVAVVLPTQTWQAYNFRDENGDHLGDTWYADPRRNTVRLGRAFLDRGVPPHYKYYDEPFLRWLQATGKQPDYLSDAELNRASGRELARDYGVIVFPGHHEYVTAHEYDAVTEFRNRGGNLMFLSANNFFWQVRIHGDVMTRVVRWRDIGRPEARLIGVEYFDWDHATGRRGPWIVHSVKAAPWIFAGSGLGLGSRFASGGIEADSTCPYSPANVRVLARIPNIFGDGRSAEMTYYERGRAKVFAAGAFTLSGSVWQPPVQRMIGNLWGRLAG